MTSDQQILLPTQHARTALMAFNNSPEMLQRILAGSGLTIDRLSGPGFTFPMSALWPIADNLASVFGPSWFLDVPLLWSLEVQSEYGLAIRSASDFGGALDVLAEFGHVRWPIGRADGRITRSHYMLKFTPSVRFNQNNWQMITALIALNFQTTTQSIIGDDIARLEYRMAGSPPPYERQFAEKVKGTLSWNHDQLAFLAPADLLQRVPRMANDATFAAMVGTLREQAMAKHHVRSVSMIVQQALTAVTRGQASAGEIADKIGLSRRTMERRLEDEGTSFRKLAEASLRDRFEMLVADPGLSSAAIAERLGYHDASSLQRACRRWFGKPFRAVRHDTLAG